LFYGHARGNDGIRGIYLLLKRNLSFSKEQFILFQRKMYPLPNRNVSPFQKGIHPHSKEGFIPFQRGIYPLPK
jgi:hypothetical protein